ncbi:hypothetical protein [Streptomyces tubercidicus]|uniref:hypothetical protein n=1 Tax=Streptomyces tubercidicus TaxID=47759 RepID=UPI0036768096
MTACLDPEKVVQSGTIASTGEDGMQLRFLGITLNTPVDDSLVSSAFEAVWERATPHEEYKLR